ncbi:MAG: nodulation protein NfeD [Thermoleophilia bacterium]|nr:nodulation protein NfeD [Thermoleophilia bacterium]
MSRLRALLALVLAAGVSLALTAEAHAQEPPRVLAIEFANDVNPVTAGFVTGSIERAEDDGYDAIVILLDTPGGLADSMREIYQRMLESPLPVIVYVSPEGARAASAGVWIGQAGDILAMAPQTNIGSSTPISVGGEDIQEDLRKKVVNDAAKSLRALAEEHGRNVDWVETAVREAANLSSREALAENVIDLIAPDLDALLAEIDGTVTKGTKEIVLRTAGADVTVVEMSLWKRVLDTIIDPNIVILLMSLGVLAITVEIFNPGLIFPAAFGAISLIIGLFGLNVLPFSWAGILLVLVALGFFVAEAFVASGGALALAGAVSFIFGAIMLFDPAGDLYQVSLPVAIAIAAVVAAFVAFAVAKALRARRAPPLTGGDELAGASGVVREALVPEGIVFVHGELWRARSATGSTIPAGSAVLVDRLAEGLVLEVVPAGERAVAL